MSSIAFPTFIVIAIIRCSKKHIEIDIVYLFVELHILDLLYSKYLVLEIPSISNSRCEKPSTSKFLI